MRLIQALTISTFWALLLTAMASAAPMASLTADAINAADLGSLPAELAQSATAAPQAAPDPAIVKLQILLDRAGASPGVIDGFDGDNVRKAVRAFETMVGLSPDGKVGPDLVARLQTD